MSLKWLADAGGVHYKKDMGETLRHGENKDLMGYKGRVNDICHFMSDKREKVDWNKSYHIAQTYHPFGSETATCQGRFVKILYFRKILFCVNLECKLWKSFGILKMGL